MGGVRIRAERHSTHMAPEVWARLCNEDGLWYESPEEVAEGFAEGDVRRSRLRAIHEAMKALPQKHREVLDLYFFHDKTYRDIGAIYGGRNPGNIYRLVQSAIKLLRKEFADSVPDPQFA